MVKDQDYLKEKASFCIDLAKKLGATDSTAIVKHSISETVNFNKISIEEGAQNKNSILKSYDLFLNNRYQVVVNEKTLERVKNYFK